MRLASETELFWLMAHPLRVDTQKASDPRFRLKEHTRLCVLSQMNDLEWQHEQ
ncbi:hypothetical protein D3C76_184230 [compost metagenome]|jgi:hypothetical protein|nr:hypothetical protein PS843_03745 [Pseudomonas fluorescens]